MATQCWIIRQNIDSFIELSDLIREPNEIWLENEIELATELTRLRATLPMSYRGDARLPADFVRPRIALPNRGSLPDYMEIGSYTFVSEKFRRVICQPDDVVQFWPIDSVGASDQIGRQDFRWLRVLPYQPAMDLEASKCRIRRSRNRVTGEEFWFAMSIDRFVLRADLVPNTDLFHAAETFATILAVDSLAERVLRAGCTGIEFADPETIGVLNGVKRHRTADGIGERILG